MTARWAVLGILVVALVSGSCSQDKQLDAHRVLGSSLEQMIERWGEPERYTPDPERQKGHGFAGWSDVLGVKLTAFSLKGKIIRVTYRFRNMDPFDEVEAFNLINVDPDPDEVNHLTSPGAKRWTPFEDYQKLTVSPASKMVAVGNDPMHRVHPDRPEVAVVPDTAASGQGP